MPRPRSPIPGPVSLLLQVAATLIFLGALLWALVGCVAPSEAGHVEHPQHDEITWHLVDGT